MPGYLYPPLIPSVLAEQSKKSEKIIPLTWIDGNFLLSGMLFRFPELSFLMYNDVFYCHSFKSLFA